MKKIKTSNPKVLWKSNCLLGEGISWVKELNSLYFVDIKKKKILNFNIKNKKKRIIKVNKEIGFITHIKKNNFILGLQNELRIQNLKTKKIIKSIFIEKNKQNRINDGKTDPIGNLWFGTMDKYERSIQNGSLYKLDKKLNLEKIDENYMITNGPAFIDKFNFYHTDSKKKKIYKIKINRKNEIIKKKIFRIFTNREGSPDGMTLDANLNLWVAHYGGGRISVLNTKGDKIHEVKFSAKNITNCIFGGKENNEVFVTSATKGMKKKDFRKFKDSGSLFSFKTNIKGASTRSFNFNL